MHTYTRLNKSWEKDPVLTYLKDTYRFSDLEGKKYIL